MQYIAGVATLIALTVSASFWLIERVHTAYFYRENIGIVACDTQTRAVVIANRGDRELFVSRVQLWMPGRTSDWQAPSVEINQTIMPGQFYKFEFRPPRFDNGEIARGLSPIDFENLIRKASNNDPCVELDFFAGFDSHYLDLVQASGKGLNTFPVGGYLEYWNTASNVPVRVALDGKGTVRKNNQPPCTS